jgi:hypothetical protein
LSGWLSCERWVVIIVKADHNVWFVALCQNMEPIVSRAMLNSFHGNCCFDGRAGSPLESILISIQNRFRFCWFSENYRLCSVTKSQGIQCKIWRVSCWYSTYGFHRNCCTSSSGVGCFRIVTVGDLRQVIASLDCKVLQTLLQDKLVWETVAAV